MVRRLLRVALTGGIATGKSHCLRAFSALGVPTIDADVAARQAVEPGTYGYDHVVARFGRSVIRGDGAIDRAALGRIVFGDQGARRDLEAIVHPAVRQTIAAWLDLQSESLMPDAPGFAIADIPLLYEAGRDRDFDRVVVAACTAEQQIGRLMARDNLSRESALARLAAQWPIDDKRRRADYVIDTGGTLEQTDAMVVTVYESLRGEIST